jgi:radical S-adenosyl methionine domain-containing protein 2
MRKLNIAGGEPFLHPKFLTEILRYCKEELHVESISIVSNGSKIKREWMRKNCQWLDILAVSCDSFNAETNKLIGRGVDGGNVMRFFQIAEWCRTFEIKSKFNTVVNIHNWDEDMAKQIQRVAPFRWKVFQCLLVEGENDNKDRVRDARGFLISDEQWRTFCDRHQHLPCYVPEDNSSMAGSYLLLNEYMRFMDKGKGELKLSESILDVGVRAAMDQVVWDKKKFIDRGGIYDWSRTDVPEQSTWDVPVPKQSSCGGGSVRKELEY